MKRSESVLVYAVTAVLAVILVVAVVFGNEGEAAGRGTADASKEGGLTEALGLGPQDGGPADGSSADGSSADGRGDDPTRQFTAVGPASAEGGLPGGVPPVDLPAQYDTPLGPLRSSGNVATAASVLGPFRAENQMDGARYRVVEVRRGDTFSELVQKWTGDAANAATVQSMNEELDTASLRAGDELWFPWVDEAELLLAWQSRTQPRVAAPRARSTPDAPERPVEPAAGEVHEIVKGESLWRIAERKVGLREASDYVQAILRANPSIRDAGSIRAGDKIVLPPAR